MKSLFTNNGIKGYIQIGACALALVTCVLLLITNAVPGYPIQNGAWIICFEAVAILTLVASFILSAKNTLISDALLYVAFVSIGVSIAMMVSARVVLASGLFTWDPYNELGWRAYNTSVTSVVPNLIAELGLIVSAFMAGKEEKTRRHGSIRPRTSYITTQATFNISSILFCVYLSSLRLIKQTTSESSTPTDGVKAGGVSK